MNYDLKAAVTSWTAQALEELAPGAGWGYIVTIDREPPHQMVRIALVQPGGWWLDAGVSWPPGYERVRDAVRRVLDDFETD